MNAFLIPLRRVCLLIVVVLSPSCVSSVVSADQHCFLTEGCCLLRYDLGETASDSFEPDPCTADSFDPSTDELCGWVGTSAHDSIACLTVLEEVTPTTLSAARHDDEPVSASDTAGDSPIMQGAAIALASVGISVEQLLEPLALATPYLDNSLSNLRDYQRWITDVMKDAERERQAGIETALDAILLEEQLARIAYDEPVDIDGYGHSVIVDDYPITEQRIPPGETGIEVLPLNRLVGSSPIIVTIEEVSDSYELSPRNLKLWSVLPASTHPFCIRAESDSWDPVAMWSAFDERLEKTVPMMAQQQRVQVAKAADVSMEEFTGYDISADCLLASWVWTAECFVMDHQTKLSTITPNNTGRTIARVSKRQEQLVEQWTNALVRRWNFNEEVEEPVIIDFGLEASPAGAALLTRAGAIVAESVIEIAAVKCNLK
ncbi:MAG: hypothetical protein AAGG48_09935 [Planctomycetota bacterium]